MKLLISICFLALASCASSEIINGPDGTPHHLVHCGVSTQCYETATELCGGKYKIINTSSNKDITDLLVKCEH